MTASSGARRATAAGVAQLQVPAGTAMAIDAAATTPPTGASGEATALGPVTARAAATKIGPRVAKGDDVGRTEARASGVRLGIVTGGLGLRGSQAGGIGVRGIGGRVSVIPGSENGEAGEPRIGVQVIASSVTGDLGSTILGTVTGVTGAPGNRVGGNEIPGTGVQVIASSVIGVHGSQVGETATAAMTGDPTSDAASTGQPMTGLTTLPAQPHLSCQKRFKPMISTVRSGLNCAPWRVLWPRPWLATW